MTIIVNLGNSEQVIQISDRRLSANGKLIDDEYGKGGIIVCDNARMSYAFTGIARAGRFDTSNWLLSEIPNCAKPEYTIDIILTRLVQKLSDEFNTNPDLQAISPEHKRLTVSFLGYSYGYTPPLGALITISNFEDIDRNETKITANWSNIAKDEFQRFDILEPRPNDGEISSASIFGAFNSIHKSEVDELKQMLIAKKPPQAIIDKTISIIHKASDRPESQGVIGKQLSCCILPRDRSKGSEHQYHTGKTVEVIHGTPYLYLTSKVVTVVGGFQIVSIDKNDPLKLSPIAYPKVGRNQPCPCKSGKKYKNCHGK